MADPFLTPREARVLWLALGGLLLLRLALMVWLPLTEPTEARYAEIARKMVETGNWITPQFDYGLPFWAKPPLHTWASAAGIAAFGATPFAARLGILFSALLTGLVLWHLAARSSGRDTALVALTVTATALLAFASAAFVQTDMVLTLGLMLSLAGFWLATREGARLWGWLFFAGQIVGLLAKGPIAVVLTGIPLTLWLIVSRDWRSLARLPWLGGTALTVALVVPWYWAAESATPGYLRYFLWGEHVERFLTPGWNGDLYGKGREQPKGMIWLFALVAALPWALLIPAQTLRSLRAPRPPRAALNLYLLLWVLGPLLFFTLSANIVLAYVLPCLSPAALLGVRLWLARPGWLSGRALLTLGVGSTAALFTALLVALWVAPERLPLPSAGPLVAQAQGGRLAVLGPRLFSAEFAAQGALPRFESLAELSDWMGAADFALIPASDVEAALPVLGVTAQEVARQGDIALVTIVAVN